MEALIVVDMQTDFTAAVVQRKDTRRVEVKPGRWRASGAQALVDAGRAVC